jgi:hypothetical protein
MTARELAGNGGALKSLRLQSEQQQQRLRTLNGGVFQSLRLQSEQHQQMLRTLDGGVLQSLRLQSKQHQQMLRAPLMQRPQQAQMLRALNGWVFQSLRLQSEQHQQMLRTLNGGVFGGLRLQSEQHQQMLRAPLMQWLQQAQMFRTLNGGVLQSLRLQSEQHQKLLRALAPLEVLGAYAGSAVPSRDVEVIGLEAADGTLSPSVGRWDLLVEWLEALPAPQRLELENRVLFVLVAIDGLLNTIRPSKSIAIAIDAATILVALHAVLVTLVRGNR